MRIALLVAGILVGLDEIVGVLRIETAVVGKQAWRMGGMGCVPNDIDSVDVLKVDSGITHARRFGLPGCLSILCEFFWKRAR